MRFIFVVIMSVVLDGCFFSSVKTGSKGVKVSFGEMGHDLLSEGLHVKMPWVSLVEVDTKQQSKSIDADCFSSDLQHINAHLNVIFNIPDGSVFDVVQKYNGDPFTNFIEPKLNEAFKEVSSTRTAEEIVKEREKVKHEALLSVRNKIGSFFNINDLVIQDIQLSKELQVAIEQKMVQEQEAAKAKFLQMKERTDSETKVIKSRGEAESIEIINKTMKDNQSYLQLELIKKWDGHAPLVVGETRGNFILPLK